MKNDSIRLPPLATTTRWGIHNTGPLIPGPHSTDRQSVMQPSARTSARILTALAVLAVWADQQPRVEAVKWINSFAVGGAVQLHSLELGKKNFRGALFEPRS